MNKQPVSYLQTDTRWKNVAYAVKGESATIGGSGCGPTALAMVLATWADPKVTPATECKWALAHGYKALNHGTYYGYFVPAAKRYGLSCTQLNSVSIFGNAGSGLHAQVLQYLAQGDLIIACMGPGNWTKSGHFVLLWDVQGDIAYVNDPASTLDRRTRGSWAMFRQQVKFYWRIRRPASIPLNREEEPEVSLSVEDVRKIAEETAKVAISNYFKEAAKQPEPDWSVKEGWWQKAEKSGIVDGSRPESPMKRDEAVAILGRLGLVRTQQDPTETAETLGMD